MKCTQPGCAGEIADGYCMICGLPAATPADAGPDTSAMPATQPARPPAPVRPSSVTGRGPSSATGRCRQPRCSGAIADGYCDVCGTPAAGPGSSSAADAPDSGPSGLSTRTRGSSRLDSTALGSARLAGDSVATRRTGGSQRLRSTGRIGAGLVRVPPAPTTDPAEAVMANPVVPENKRHCPSCQSPVGRSRDGRPGRTSGFCPNCRNPFSFDPKLAPGDLIAHQYEVAGCLAHGGMGWIYLARDKNVSDRWVVLKGLLNSGDADALAAALAEQQFLAQVEHPSIVEIYNFVTHDDAGYIVMEYVGGRSLKQLLKDRMRANDGAYDPLPLDQAIAYVLEVLPALQYLHDLGLVYCDFKPDNVVQVGDGLKLIDLGGVRRIDDTESAIYGTIGYQAPEVARVGPSIASDVYTIGRTLLVLAAEFRGYQTTWQESLPGAAEIPLLGERDSLHRLLQKACAADPADRFASADELRTQLLGLLREEVGRGSSSLAPTSAPSVLFETPQVSGNDLGPDELPPLREDPTDPQFAWLSNIDVTDPAERLRALDAAPATSPEVALDRARCALALGDRELLERACAQMLAEDPWEWRAVWMQGLAALAERRFGDAQKAFNAVYGQVPGELAPKLALGLACELGGEPAIAEALYRVCAGTDAAYVVPAAFGIARLREGAGDLPGAIDALGLVPVTSRAHGEAAQLRARHQLALSSGPADLARALDSITDAPMEPVDRERFTAEVLEAALGFVRGGGSRQPAAPAGGVRIGRYAATEPELRDGLEATYRQLASHEPEKRVAWVDRANAIRNWSLT